MNELSTIPLTMSTLEIAGLCGKLHKNVLADARKMLSELEIQRAEFSARYIDAKGEAREVLNLPKRETLILVSGYSTELRARIIDRWMQLEAAIAPASSVNGLGEDERRTIGGIVKGIVHKELAAIIPALISEAVASGEFAIGKGYTAGQVIDLAKVPGASGLRGLDKFVSGRLVGAS
ncbi:Rha family transcriptional regulator [Methylocystis parvus]|uniref:Rha family transcriptional regulator n=1 Tax=Methylocystis parvus TaxID=134 RepID=UPI003C723BBB